MQYRDDLPEETIKKLESIERRQIKIAKEIRDLGYTVYLNSGGISIMDGDTHDERQVHALYDNQVWTIDVGRGWDGGDW